MCLICLWLRLLGFFRHISVWMNLIFRSPTLTQTNHRVPIIYLLDEVIVKQLTAPQEFGFSFYRMVMSHARYGFCFMLPSLVSQQEFLSYLLQGIVFILLFLTRLTTPSYILYCPLLVEQSFVWDWTLNLRLLFCSVLLVIYLSFDITSL